MGRKSTTKVRKAPTQKVNRWLAALLIRLQNKDLNHLTIDDIAALAEKSKSTIYEYFQSKEDILVAACQTRTSTLAVLIQDRGHSSDNTVVVYRHLVEDFTEAIADISISFLHQIKTYYPVAWVVIDQFTDGFIDLLKGLYEKGITEGHFQPMSVELLAILDKYFVTQVVTDSSAFSTNDYTLSLLVNDYLTLRLNGLVLRKQ